MLVVPAATRGLFAFAALLVTIVVVSSGALVTPAFAATDHVTNCNSSGGGSLPDVIAASASGDTIVFDLDCTGASQIVLAAVLTLNNVSIDGTGHSVTISGNDVTRIFNTTGGTVTLTHLTLTHGYAGGGGAIVNSSAGANLTLRDSTLSANSAFSGTGGAVDVDTGSLTVDGSTFDGNTSFSSGGAIFSTTTGSVTIRDSTFTNNVVTNATQAGGAIFSGSTLTVDRSTFSGNSAPKHGGAILQVNRAFTLRNSTLSGNSATAGDGGGVYFNASSANATLQNNTFSGNTATVAGSSIFHDTAAGTLTVANTIVSGSGGSNCSGTITDGGYNLQFGDSTCGFADHAVSADPQLGALANNGGATQTMALGVESLARDGGNAAVCQNAGVGNVDQRGSARNAGTRGRCDIGAYDTGTSTRHVTNCNDTGTGSLRNTIAAAASGNTIVFDQDCSGGSAITLSTEIALTGTTLTIDGTGRAVTISGGDTTRILNVDASSALALTHLTLTHGNSSDTGGAIENAGTLTISYSTFDANHASFGGGAIYEAIGTITSSTFTGNTANAGGAIVSHDLTVDRSTFSGNSALGEGGAIRDGGDLVLRNSTVTGNTSGSGAVWEHHQLTLENDTISGNTGTGFNDDSLASTVSNTIISGNSGGDCGEPTGDGGYNLTSDTSCGFSNHWVHGDPLLATLADNGGPTETMALGALSPAIAAGSSSLCLAAGVGNIDQRGHTRNAASRGACDIGAYDTGGGASSLHVTNCNSSGTGSFSEITSAANSGDTVVFDLDCSGSNQIVVPGEIAIGSRTVIVDGVGHQVTLNGNDSVRFFTVGAAGSLSLKQLTLTHGHASGDGGAILSAGLLGLRNVTITRSVASGNGGAISSSSLLSIQGGTLDNNGALGDGGALAVSGTTGVQGVTLTSNNANNNGGAIANAGTLTVNRDMFNGNSGADGGALYSSAGTLSLLNSTLSFNLQTGGGGGGLSVYGGTATVRNSTLVDDQTFGFGSQELYNGGGSVAVGNSIVLASTACAGVVTDDGYNLTDSFDSSCGFTDHAVSTSNAQIGNLANNGGPTMTMALAATSPAVGAGSASMCQAAGINNIDQRLRPRNAGARAVCDIGAYDTGASGPSAATTLIKRTPGKIAADGSSTATVTVVARDAAGRPITVGGATVTLSTTLGSLSSVTDVGNGTYTATLTSVTTPGTAHITGTLNASPIAASTGVDFVPGGPSGATTTMNHAPNRIVADGISTATITVRARDANGNLIQTGGATVLLNTTLGSLGSVTDNGNGAYTATLTSATTRGKATVSGSINGDPIAATTSVDFVPGAPSGATTTIGRSPSRIVADGITTSTITVRAKDASGNVVQVGGATVVLNTTRGSLGSVTDNGNGTYTATLTSSTSRGVATISGTIDSDPIVSTTSVDFVPGPPSGAATTIVRSAASIPADGTSTVTITVRAKDQFGNLEQSGGAAVTLHTSLGILGPVTDNNNGTHSATLTSSTSPGIATITGTINGQAITGGGTTVTFT